MSELKKAFDWQDETGRRNRRMRALYDKMHRCKFNDRSITPEQFNQFHDALAAAFTLLESFR